MEEDRAEGALLRPHLARAIVAALDEVLAMVQARGWFAAADLLARRLRQERALHSAERRLLGDALHDLVRGLRRLRALAGLPRADARQLYLAWLLDRVLERTAVPPRALLEQAAAAHIDVAALATRRAELSLVPLPPERMGEALSYPEWLVRTLCTEFGCERAEVLLRTQNGRAPLTVRANLLRCHRAQLRERLAAEGVRSRETALSSHGLVLQSRINVYGLATFRDGWMELQDEGSQLVAELVAPPPGSLVVDACAGAGGKSLALGSLLRGRGRILALDVDPRKLKELQKRARRAGLTNLMTRVVPAQGPPPVVLARGAARVLVDAPCSGLGVLRRNPEARWRVQPDDVTELAARQRAILSTYAGLVAPGGRLIYATCTVLRAENDQVVEDFLRAHPDFSLMPIKEILGGERAALLGDGERLRLLPEAADGPDGFYAAVLRRRSQPA